MRVLVIEENQQLVRDLNLCLQVRYPQCTIVSVSEGAKGVEMVETESPDLVMIDSSLPDIDVLDLISKIREFSDVPLVVLSEAETDIDRARGLETGADEYITKPFSPIELLARVKALLRRTQGIGFRPDCVVSLDRKLSLNFTTHEVFLYDRQIKLTPIEYRLLSELVRNEGRVFAHRSLLERVWGPEYIGDPSLVKRNICRLRKKLCDDPSNPRMILTEHGVGYKFIAPT